MGFGLSLENRYPRCGVHDGRLMQVRSGASNGKQVEEIRDLGVIAQEVECYFPSWCMRNVSGHHTFRAG